MLSSSKPPSTESKVFLSLEAVLLSGVSSSWFLLLEKCAVGN